jgi:hypothetical protein
MGPSPKQSGKDRRLCDGLRWMTSLGPSPFGPLRGKETRDFGAAREVTDEHRAVLVPNCGVFLHIANWSGCRPVDVAMHGNMPRQNDTI